MLFKHPEKPSDSNNDNRICSSFKALFNLQNHAKGFSFSASNNAGTVLSGRHQSKFRGRGMNFEELRNYQKGDDIRTLDWRVTLRTGKPHVRAYTEEKDHQIIICIDLRNNMFFSSVDTMKSVVAAEIAAMCIWRTLTENDRVGALIFTDNDLLWFKPQRNQQIAIKILRAIATKTEQLASKESVYSRNENPQSITDICKQILKSSSKNSVYIVLSDFHDFDDTTLTIFKKLKAHNNLLPVVINDPLDSSLASQQDLIISDGKWQLALADEGDTLNARYEEEYLLRTKLLKDLFKDQDFPVLSLTTDGKHIAQFRRFFGVSK